jgi:SAM-dependent methyltransferase
MRPETSTVASPDVVRRATCRICDATDLDPILSLGPTPLANAFLRSADEFGAERSYPLDVYFCGRCGLLQLLDVVNPEVLFRHYLYVTGTSATQIEHNRAYARAVIDRLGLGSADLVVEVASNDGTLLRAFAAQGVRTLGIEPARNLAAEASAAGIETVGEFFTGELARRLRAERGAARAVVANNVLAHVDNPGDFLAGCRELIADDGLIAIEVPYVGELLDRVEYDTVYHEHLSYFSIGSLLRLAESAALSVVRLDRVPVHGGSLRLFFSRSPGGHAPEVLALEAGERRAGLMDAARYRRFAADVEDSRTMLVDLLERLAAAGRVVAGYGAPAKGNTLLNFCRIGPRLVRYTVDRNPRKVGLFTPGMHIPVRELSALTSGEDVPDHLVILAWNLAEEIMQQQQAYRERGGRFIVPVPRARVV